MFAPRLYLSLFAVLLLVAADLSAQSVTRRTFLVIEKVQELLEQERYREAASELDALTARTKGNPYDHAVANQYLAQARFMLDDTAGARAALESALASPDLPADMRANLNLFYGTVLLSEDDYDGARRVLQDWFETEQNPTPGQIISYAYATYMSGDAASAETLVARALAAAPDPLDNWYQLHYRVLFDLGRHAEAERTLRRLIARRGDNKTYWRMLANHFLRLERGNQALAVIMVAYMNDVIESPSEFDEIVSLFGFIDAPEKGARLLSAWIDEERIPRSAETMQKLGNMWLLARERENAKAALRVAAELAPDGRTFELLGGIYFEDEDWPAAHAAYRDALRAGGLEEPLRISMLAGISALRAGLNEEARDSLQAAAASDELRPQAESLLKQLDES